MERKMNRCVSFMLAAFVLVGVLVAAPVPVQAADGVVSFYNQLDANGTMLEMDVDTYYANLGKLGIWLDVPSAAGSVTVSMTGVKTGHKLFVKESSGWLSAELDVPLDVPEDTYKTTVHYSIRKITYPPGRPINIQITFYDITSLKTIDIRRTYVEVPITSVETEKVIAINPTNLVPLTVKLQPAGAAKRHLTYTSSNPAVATVSVAGWVKGEAAGEAIITSSAPSGAKAECYVAVLPAGTNPVVPIGLSFSKTSLSLKKSDIESLVPQFTPAGTNVTKLTWSSSNPAVATVSESGEVQGKTKGTAIITAVSPVGENVKASASVSVSEEAGKNAPRVQKLTLNEKTAGLAMGKRLTLKVSKATPVGASASVKWSSSNTKVATVNSRGVVVAKWQKGTAVITATATDGSKKKASCKITVGQGAQSVKLATKKNLTMKKGAKLTVKAQVMPRVAWKKLSYTSSKPKVASVSSTGKIIAKAKGKTIITLTTTDGTRRKAIIRLTVK